MQNKNGLDQILSDWSYWENPPSKTIPRAAIDEHITLDSDIVLAIQGVRRCGKSTALAQIMSRKNLDPKSCFFVNFEDPRLSENLDPDLLTKITEFAQARIPRGPKHFFLDEIQNVSNWEKWVHQQVERPRDNHFVITGSNASLLSGDLGTVLTGRHLTLELFPFDLQEFRLARPKDSVDTFLSIGGFPRSLTHEKRENLLREYYNDIIEKDVRRHVAVRTSSALQQLTKAVFESMGSELSQRKLAKVIGVSADTVGSYLSAATSAYLILPCPYFTYSEKQSASRNRKFYPIDLGLRNAVITRTGRDQGKALEAAVFHYLRKSHSTVYYWRGEHEIDFVTSDHSGLVAYQVSWDGLKERHKLAYSEFKKLHPKVKPLKVISRKNIKDFLSGNKI